MRRKLELYHALLNSGQPDAAVQLYYDRFNTSLNYSLGAYATTVELLSPLFPQGFDQPPALRIAGDRAYTANALALAFFNLGDQAQAQRLYAVTSRLNLEARDTRHVANVLANVLVNIGLSLEDIGQLASAERAYRLGLALAQATHEQRQIDIAYIRLVGLLATIGSWIQGKAAYAALQASPEEEIKNTAFAYVNVAHLRWGEKQELTLLVTQALSRSHEERNLAVERLAQRLAGEVAFARGNLPQAQEAWQAAYAIAQREGVPLGPYLADLARVHAAQKDGEQAKGLIAEALALGGRNVALATVEVHTALGETMEAKRYVDAAYKEAWADGPPYAFYHELGRIRVALKTLGLPEPQLPAFDPSRVQPIPDEEEIRKFIEELNKGKKSDPQDRILTLASNAEATTFTTQKEKRLWWKFWSQN